MTRELLHQSGSSEAFAILRQCVVECKKAQHIARRFINLSRTHPCPQERGCSESVSDFSFVILSTTRWSVMCLFSQRSRVHCAACCTASATSSTFHRQMFNATIGEAARTSSVLCSVLHLLCQVDIEVLSAITPSKSAYSESGTAHSNSSFRRPSWCARRLSVAFPISE